MVAFVAGLLIGLTLLDTPQAASKPAQAAPPSAAGTSKAQAKPDPTPYQLDKALFTPDDRWRYEGSEQFDRQKARFGGAIAYQAGIVTIGDNRWLPAGAYVKYRVWKADTVEAARKAFERTELPERKSPFTRRSVRPLRAGDEARDVSETVSAEGNATSYLRRIHIRYGEYLVEISAYSDLKAFGPAPRSGSRPWLSEAPTAKVLQAALDHWKTVKTASRK